MQRIAIFNVKSFRRFALLFIFFASVFTGTVFLNASQANAATNYKTETPDNIKKKIKALKYYYGLSYCTQQGDLRNFKQEIKGGDIDKGPRWWIGGGGSTVRLGQLIDTWGNKDGNTGCNGESDDAPGWVNDMFSIFGIDISDKRAALVSLGYDCKKSGDEWVCTNKDINSTTSNKGILYQVKNASYLNGTNPLTTTPDYNAMQYYLALHSLTTNSMCNAAKGGSSNLVSITEVKSNGSLSSSDWQIKNDGGPGRNVVAGIPIDNVYGSGNTCEESAKATRDYAQAYLDWSGRSACAATFTDKATDEYFLTGCAKGWANQIKPTICATTAFNGSDTINKGMQNACFRGQGNPIDAQGTASGMLCYYNLAYKAVGDLAACIKGSKNTSDANYCSVQYPAPDTMNGGGMPNDTNKSKRDACKEGQKLAVSGGNIPSDDTIGNTGSTPAGDDETTTSCGVEGIGWIVCPIISFTSDLLAEAFKGLADNFLATELGLFDTDSGTYIAWSIFRNFANVAFVIAFLFIIFSQLTGIGVSNYGVKKLLPRIVIAAILVNISFFICQIAVDLSNILGYSLKSVFDNIAIAAEVPTSGDASANGFGIAAIVAGVIATATIAYFSLGVLIPVLLGALVGVLMVVLMLIARKAIIILLIVLSPLAFVAFLLPNTESMFTKWRKLFVALLLLFPIISVVFGVSSLASQIILKAGPGSGSLQILQIVAVGVAALPFFIVPSLLKGSLNGIGNVGAKLNGFASKMGGGVGKGFTGSRWGKYEQYKSARRTERGNLIQSGAYNRKYGKFDPRRVYNAASKVNEGINSVSGQFGTRLAASGISLAAEEQSKNTKAAALLLGSKPRGRQELRDIQSTSKDVSMRRAAVEKMVATNDITGINQMVSSSHGANWSPEDRIHLADTLGSSSNRPAYIGQGALGQIRDGKQQNIQGLVKSAIDNNAYSSAKIAGGDADELTFVAQTAAELGGDTHDKIASAAQDALSDGHLAPTITKNMAQVNNLARKEAPTAEQLGSLK